MRQIFPNDPANFHASGTSLLEILIALAIFSTVALGAGFISFQSIRITREALQCSQELAEEKLIEIITIDKVGKGDD